MNSEQSLLSYMKLEDTKRTSFRFMEKTFKVVDAPASEFDTFISEVVEEIKNVDRAKWPIFQKWRVINACLGEGVLTLVELPDGTLKLEVPPTEPGEVETSSEVQAGG